MNEFTVDSSVVESVSSAATESIHSGTSPIETGSPLASLSTQTPEKVAEEPQSTILGDVQLQQHAESSPETTKTPTAEDLTQIKQTETDRTFVDKYGIGLITAKAYITELRQAGKVSDKLFENTMQLSDEDLVARVARFYPKNREMKQALEKQDKLVQTIRAENERNEKVSLLASIYAEQLGIPENQVDMETMDKMAKKMASSMPLDSMSYKEVKTKMVQMCEEDDEFQNYVMELYKKQLYQKAYEEKAGQLRAVKLYPEDYIHEAADQHAKRVVREFEERLIRSKQNKTEIKEMVAENVGGMIVFLIDVLVPQILQEMKGGK